MIFLKQSTAYTAKIGPFLDETDGKTAETGLTIAQADVRLSKNGGDIAQKTEATSCTHDELGYYDCPLDTTDTGTLGKLQLFVHESGALPVFHDFMVLPANVYDSMFSTDKLEVDVAQWLGTAAATPTTAGVPEVDLTHIAGAAVSATTAQLGVNAVQVSGSGPAADNLETAALAYSATRGLAGTALPAAAADAAGGLPISDAGGLDLDAKIGALTFTVAGDVDVNVQSWKGAAAQDMTGDAFARLGAPAGVSVSADIAAVKAETAAIVVDISNLEDLSANDVITAAIEGTVTVQQALVAIFDTFFAKLSGAGTASPIYRNRADGVNRASYTIADIDGNRAANVTLNFTDL